MSHETHCAEPAAAVCGATLARQDSAMVLSAGRLAFTGSQVGVALQLGALLLLLGGILVVWRRMPRHRR